MLLLWIHPKTFFIFGPWPSFSTLGMCMDPFLVKPLFWSNRWKGSVGKERHFSMIRIDYILIATHFQNGPYCSCKLTSSRQTKQICLFPNSKTTDTIWFHENKELKCEEIWMCILFLITHSVVVKVQLSNYEQRILIVKSYSRIFK